MTTEATAAPSSTTAAELLKPIASLMLPDSVHLNTGAQRVLAFVQSFDVDNPEAYQLAADELAAIKGRMARLEEQRTSITKPINDGLRAINALFKPPATTLEQCEVVLKQKLLAYEIEQKRIADEARRKAEELAAQERRRLEAQAAEQRRIAEEQAAAAAAAAEAQRAANAAAAAALAAGDKETADRREREAQAQAQAQALAQAAAQRANAEAQSAAMTAQVVTAPVVHMPPPRAAGTSVSKKLEFEVVDLAALVLFIATGRRPDLVDAAGGGGLAHPELLGLVCPDDVRLRAYVKGVGTACNLPGVRVTQGQTMSVKAAR